MDYAIETIDLTTLEARFAEELTNVHEAGQLWRDLACEIGGLALLESFPEPTILVG